MPNSTELTPYSEYATLLLTLLSSNIAVTIKLSHIIILLLQACVLDLLLSLHLFSSLSPTQSVLALSQLNPQSKNEVRVSLCKRTK